MDARKARGRNEKNRRKRPRKIGKTQGNTYDFCGSATDINESLLGLEPDTDFVRDGGTDCGIDFEIAEQSMEGTDTMNQDTYLAKKASLIGDTIEVNKGGETITWQVRSDIDEMEVNLQPDTNIGLTGFQFDKSKRGYGDSSRIDMGELFHAVSGRYMEDDVRNLNAFIMEENIERKNEHRRTIKLTSPRELDVFLGILLLGRLENNTNLWGFRGKHKVREETWKSKCFKLAWCN